MTKGDMPGWAVNRALEEEAREGNLPKYAQDKLRILRQALREARAVADDVLRRTDPEGSRIILDPLGEPSGVGIDARTTVRFKTGVGYLDVDLRDDWLQIRASDNIEIRPRVSNAIDVRDTPRWSTR